MLKKVMVVFVCTLLFPFSASVAEASGAGLVRLFRQLGELTSLAKKTDRAVDATESSLRATGKISRLLRSSGSHDQVRSIKSLKFSERVSVRDLSERARYGEEYWSPRGDWRPKALGPSDAVASHSQRIYIYDADGVAVSSGLDLSDLPPGVQSDLTDLMEEVLLRTPIEEIKDASQLRDAFREVLKQKKLSYKVDLSGHLTITFKNENLTVTTGKINVKKWIYAAALAVCGAAVATCGESESERFTGWFNLFLDQLHDDRSLYDAGFRDLSHVVAFIDHLSYLERRGDLEVELY